MRYTVPIDKDADWYQERIDYIAEFMLPERHEALKKVLEDRTRWMTVCMENTFHSQNASALIRNCEAFGLQDMYAVEEVCTFKPNLDVVKGTDKWVDLHRSDDTATAIATLRSKGYRIVATTPHREDVTPETFDVTKGPFALIFGTEHAGISDEVIASADEFLRIPMVGFVESLNVSASAAILLHTLSTRLRSSDVPWQLSEQEKLPLLMKWMMRSVRDAENILRRFSQQ